MTSAISNPEELLTLTEEYRRKPFQENIKNNEEKNDVKKNYIFSIHSPQNLDFSSNPSEENDDGNYTNQSIMDSEINYQEVLPFERSNLYKSTETIINYCNKEPSTAESTDFDSLICLAELKVSDSKLKIFNELYPIPEDPGLVSGFWILYPRPPEYNDDGIEKFINLTKAMKLQSIQRIFDMLKTDELNLRYYGLDSRIVRAICEALSKNLFVKTLDLTDNWLSVDACFHLDGLLTDNDVITHLNLSGCRIGPRGAKRLEESIGAAHALQYLNVSHCDLGDEGFKYISIGVYCNSNIQIVDFSHNNLGENTANDFQTMLTQTDTLKELNLSWNNLFSQKFWKKFVIGLIRNNSLIDLDLSWNTLSGDCAPFLFKYLSTSTNLLKLNLKNNAFGPEEAEKIGKSLVKNKTLVMLNLESNPLKTEGVLSLINSLKNISIDSKLKLIDLENIWCDTEIIPLIQKITGKLPNLNIKLGGISSNFKLTGPDPRKIFLKRANFEAMKPKKKSQKRDFGQFVMALDDVNATEDDFQKIVKKHRLKLSKSLVTEIINVFKVGDNAIDQRTLKAFYLKEYPDTQPALPVVDKKRKNNKNKSNKTRVKNNR